MIFKQNGYILLPVLIFTQLLMMIGLQDIFKAFMHKKSIFQTWQYQIEKTKIDEILNHIEARLIIGEPNCLISKMNPVMLIHKPTSWWQQYGCSGIFAQVQYYYVLELLDTNFCAIIKPRSDVQGVNYYRLTLLSRLENLQGAKFYNQTTFIKVNKNVGICNEEKYKILLGRQMQRRLFIRKMK